MRHFLARLGFVHRRLWQRDGTYRLAVLFGPAPLAGGAVAALAWATLHAPRPPPMPPPWGTVYGPRTAVSTDAPRVVAPASGMPGEFPGNLVAGWRGSVQAVEIDSTMDANVLPVRLGPLDLPQPGLDLGRIVAAGPATERFVGVGTASLVVRTAGTHTLTLRMQRTDAGRATCLTRLVFAGQRVVSNLQLDLPGPRALAFEPVSFVLQPGLYPIAVVFGCWDGAREAGAGTLTVMIRHPGEDDPRPAGADEIVRPISPAP